MKNSIKFTFVLLLSIICASEELSAKGISTDSILRRERKWNDEVFSLVKLPQPIDYGEMTEMKVTGEYVKTLYMVNEEFESLFEPAVEDSMKTNMIEMLTYDSNDFADLFEDGLGMKFIWKSKKTGKEYVVQFSNDEILNLRNKVTAKDLKAWATNKLKVELENYNAECPQTLDFMTTMNSATLDNKSFNFNLTITETEDLKIKQIRKDQKDAIHTNIHQSLVKGGKLDDTFINSLIKGGYTLKYIYTGSLSKQKMTFELDKPELEKILEETEDDSTEDEISTEEQ